MSEREPEKTPVMLRGILLGHFYRVMAGFIATAVDGDEVTGGPGWNGHAYATAIDAEAALARDATAKLRRGLDEGK